MTSGVINRHRHLKTHSIREGQHRFEALRPFHTKAEFPRHFFLHRISDSDLQSRVLLGLCTPESERRCKAEIRCGKQNIGSVGFGSEKFAQEFQLGVKGPLEFTKCEESRPFYHVKCYFPSVFQHVSIL